MSLSKMVVPVVAGGLAVFGLSFVAHMLLPHHRSDLRRMENQDEVIEAIKKGNNKAGQYLVPWMCHDNQHPHEDLAKALYAKVTVGEGFNFPKALMQSFALNLAVSAAVGFVDHKIITKTVDDRFVVLAFVATGFNCFSRGWDVAWMGEAPSTCLKYLADSTVFGLATAACFVYLK